MKRTLLFVVSLVVAVSGFAMSSSKIRQHARFLSDRMAYELDLTPYQYDDVYEINYDFIYAVNRLMDDVVFGYTDAIERYYIYLDYRNDDLRYVLNNSQFRRFMMADYFYRPIYSTGRDWRFRIYTIYSNRSFFYFDRPAGYRSYDGAHARGHYTNGFYVSRHNAADHYVTTTRIVGSQDFGAHRRNDFGSNLSQRTSTTTSGVRGHGYTVEPRPNNYSNANQSNRTQDPRYRDNSGNHNSPQINNRNNESQRGGGVSSQRGGSVSSQRGTSNPTSRGTGTSTDKTTPASTRGHSSSRGTR